MFRVFKQCLNKWQDCERGVAYREKLDALEVPEAPEKNLEPATVVLSYRRTLIKSYLYLTSVGLISGGIGRRGPESGCAPGGGAGGRGGRALMVDLLSFFFIIFYHLLLSYFWQALMVVLLSFFIILLSYFWQGSDGCIVLIFFY